MSARENILRRLRERREAEHGRLAVDFAVVRDRDWSPADRLRRFQRQLESAHAEVHQVRRTDWVERLTAILSAKAVRNLLAPRTHELGLELRDHASRLPSLLHYDTADPGFRNRLFTEVDAAVTSSAGGVAETGSLIVRPDSDQPRLMSLVPPLHVIVVDADRIHATLHQAMVAEDWARRMPTNLLLISGPSKTADIEQTLAYGVHGPRELVVLIRR